MRQGYWCGDLHTPKRENTKEEGVTHALSELVGMARALSEKNFEHRFAQHCQGELARLAASLEALRQNLKALSPTVVTSAHLIPKAAQGVAEISRQAETGVNSILGLVEEMLVDRERISGLLAAMAQGGALDLSELHRVIEKDRHSLMSLVSYLSFQDVVRQRAEQVQEMIATVEKKILEILVQLRGQVSEQMIKAEGDQQLSCGDTKNLAENAGLDQALVDALLENL